MMFWKLSLLLVILTQVWPFPYRKHHQHQPPPDHPNTWYDENHQSMRFQQHSENYVNPHYSSYPYSYQSHHNHKMHHNHQPHNPNHEQSSSPQYYYQSPVITSPETNPLNYQYQGGKNDDHKNNDMEQSGQNNEFYSSTYSSNHNDNNEPQNYREVTNNQQYSHHGLQKVNSFQLHENLNTNSSQNNMNQKEKIQQIDAFYKQKDRYSVPHSDDIGQQNNDHMFHFQHTQPNRHTDNEYPSLQNQDTPFGTQHDQIGEQESWQQEQRSNKYTDTQQTEEFGQQSVVDFETSQQVQSSNTYIDQDGEILGEQQSDVDFGFHQQKPNKHPDKQYEQRFYTFEPQQKGQKPSKYVDSQTSETLEDQETNIEIGSQQVQTANVEYVDQQQSDLELGLRQQERRSNKYTDTQQTEGLGQLSLLDFGTSQQAQSSNKYNDQDGDILREQQSDLEYEFQQKKPNKLTNYQYEQQSSSFGYQQQDLKPSKYVDSQTVETFEDQQTNIELGSQQVQTTSDYTNDPIVDNLGQQQSNIVFMPQHQRQRSNKYTHTQQTEGLEQQSLVDLGTSQQVQSTNNHDNQDGDILSEQQSDLEFGFQQRKPDKQNNDQYEQQSSTFGSQQQDLKPSKYVDSQTVEIFDEQETNMEFGSQQVQTTNDSNVDNLGQQQSDIEFGPQHQRQRSNKYTDTQQTEELGQQSVVDFGTSQQVQSSNSHIDQDEEMLSKQQSNVEFGFQQQKLNRPNNEQSSTFESHQQDLTPSKYVDSETVDQQTTIELGSQKGQTTNDYTKDYNVDNVDQQQSDLIFGPQQQQQRSNEYKYTQQTEEFGQQAVGDFGTSQLVQSSNSYIDQDGEILSQQQYDSDSGFQQQKPYRQNNEKYEQQSSTFDSP